MSIYLVAFGTFMIAGSFIGAEFSSGSISNWLSFVPRRIPVFVSKLFVISVFSALFSAVCGALTLGAAVIVAGINDVPVEQIGKLTAPAGSFRRSRWPWSVSVPGCWPGTPPPR